MLTVFRINFFSLRNSRGKIAPLLVFLFNENQLSLSMFIQAEFCFHTVMLLKVSFLSFPSIFFIEMTCYEKLGENG